MKRSIFCFSLFFVLVFTQNNISAQSAFDPSAALPQSINGWKILAADRTFNNETLYDYIDGAAELFLSFGFSKVFNRIYSDGNQSEIIVDVFYMNSSYDAYGVFSHSVGKTGNDFGQQSQVTNSSIVFWKDNFYISILCNPAADESKNVMLKIAGMLDKSITQTGQLPEIIDYLPADSLDKESIRYFRHYIWLNSHYTISNKNILNIDQNTQCVLVKYGGGQSKSVLLIIKYPTDEDAYAAMEKFVENYNPELKSGSVFLGSNGKWMGFELINNFFVGVFNADQEAPVTKLIESTEETIYNINKHK